jgi:uncharacterized protein (UPF0335 family)
MNQQNEQDNALEHYIKKCMQLEEENRELKNQIKQLLWILEEKD